MVVMLCGVSVLTTHVPVPLADDATALARRTKNIADTR